MKVPKYAFGNLRRNTELICGQSGRILQEYRSLIDQEFADFDDFLNELENQPPSLDRNVRMMLACKFLNHVYSALVLAERGLIVDAVLCERNALETAAFHWLVCLDPNALQEYGQNDIPRPADVRQRLEQLGVDITSLRDLYASASQASHVGRQSERFHSQWESVSKGKLSFGGAFAPQDLAEMFRFLPALLCWFRKPSMV